MTSSIIIVNTAAVLCSLFIYICSHIYIIFIFYSLLHSYFLRLLFFCLNKILLVLASVWVYQWWFHLLFVFLNISLFYDHFKVILFLRLIIIMIIWIPLSSRFHCFCWDVRCHIAVHVKQCNSALTLLLPASTVCNIFCLSLKTSNIL